MKICILAVLTASMWSANPASPAPPPRHEGIEWSDIWIVNANREVLPRVLLVGDSIVKGYYSAVEKAMSGKASCARYATSKFVADPDYRAELSLILKRYKFDVVHINNGLHGWGYTEKEYAEGLRDLLATLERDAPEAKWVWGMTTPLRTGENLSRFSDNNDRVIERNRIAAEIMGRHNIPIDNLYEVVRDHPEFFANDGVHYNDLGVKTEAKVVADIIEKNLPKTPNASGAK